MHVGYLMIDAPTCVCVCVSIHRIQLIYLDSTRDQSRSLIQIFSILTVMMYWEF